MFTETVSWAFKVLYYEGKLLSGCCQKYWKKESAPSVKLPNCWPKLGLTYASIIFH